MLILVSLSFFSVQPAVPFPALHRLKVRILEYMYIFV